jgi:hypothetical protein
MTLKLSMPESRYYAISNQVGGMWRQTCTKLALFPKYRTGSFIINTQRTGASINYLPSQKKQVIQNARDNEYIIVTKDSDFNGLVILRLSIEKSLKGYYAIAQLP